MNMIKKISNPVSEQGVLTSLTIESRKHISEELFLKLRDAILNGDLPEGYVFPNENELCQQLHIGRGSLREAYSCLETLHLITRTNEVSCNCKAYRCTKSEGVPSNRRDRHGAVSCKKSDPGAYSKAGGAFGRYECRR